MLGRSDTLRGQARFVWIATGLVTLFGLVAVVTAELGNARKEVELELTTLTALTRSRVGASIDDARERLQRLAASTDVLDPARCSALLVTAPIMLPEYAALYVVDRDGVVRCHSFAGTEDLRGIDPTEWPWWNGLVRGDSSFVASGPVWGDYSREWVMTFAVPIWNDGARVGVVGMSLGVDRLHELMPLDQIDPGTIITLATDDGRLIARSTGMEGKVGTPLPRPDGEEPPPGRGLGDASSIEGETYLWDLALLDAAPWRIFVGVPRSRVWVVAASGAWFWITALLLVAGGLTFLVGRLMRNLDRSFSALGVWLTDGGMDEEFRFEDGSTPPAEVTTIASRFREKVCERNRALEAERAARQRNQAIMDHAVLGIYVSDREGRIVDANRTFARMLGWDRPEEIVGRLVPELYADAPDRAVILELAAQGESSAETVWRRRDGTHFPVRLSWSDVEVEDGRGWEVFVDDLSERRDLEDQLRHSQKMEAVGRLAGGVAHDFNNRLTVIGGQAEQLREELAGTELTPLVDDILESVERSAELTHQLLAFSRKQVGRPEVLDVAAAVNGLIGMIDRLIGDDVVVRFRQPSEAVPVRVDRGQLEQILFNLSTNARDAMPKGGTLEIVVDEERIGGRAFGRIRVSDEGVGIEPSRLAQIFEPFFTTKPKGKGTGLGLSMVYGLVKQNQGDIRVESRVGEGTRFLLTFPRVEQAVDEIRESEMERDEEFRKRGRGERLLVVEDEAAVRRVLVDTLERGGYRVTAAENGKLAAALAREAGEPFALLVTDVRMPGLSGPETAAILAAEGFVPGVLFVSGYSDSEPVLPGKDGRPIDFLGKPFRREELLERVGRLLREVALHQGRVPGTS